MAAGTCFDIADIPGNVYTGQRLYRATSGFSRDERFGLVSQIRRACTSIPTNVAKNLGYLPKDQHTNLATEVIEIRRMLLAFNKTLRTSS